MGRIRDELAHGLPEKPCCRLAMLAGMTAALPADGGRIASGSASVARALLSLGREVGWTVERLDVRHGFAVQVSQGGLQPPKKPCCKRAWVRGTFLAGGTLSDPHKGYNLEWAGPKPLLETIAAVLHREEVRPRLYERTPGHWILYVRNAAEIGTVLAAIGATTALLALEEVLCERELRNQVHRQVNYETANLEKAAAAGARQAEELRRMREEGLLDALPEPLRQAAKLREEHPYASLAELCALTDPPVSKSGMNHRLRKLHAIMLAQAGEPEPDA